MTDARQQEHAHLTECLDWIDANFRKISGRVTRYQAEIQAAHDHMWEARPDMDLIDKVAMRQAIDQMMLSSDVLRAQVKKLEKLRRSPWFGHLDFRRENMKQATAHYIGIHDLRDEETR